MLKLMASLINFRHRKFACVIQQIYSNQRASGSERNYCQKPHNRSWLSKLFAFDRRRFHLKPNHIFPLGVSGMIFYYFRLSADSSEDNLNKYTPEKRWKVKLYRFLPWRTLSRVWGWACKVHLPNPAQHRFLSWYVSRYKVDLSEAEKENVEDYKTLAELFGRKLKAGARTIDPRSSIVSPCDGTVMHFGRVDTTAGQLEQVKGISYSISKFLGPTALDGSHSTPNTSYKKENPLFFCIIYLSPGDYHGFHSPVNWKIKLRRHFTGELLSVTPSVAKWIPGLFAINERVVYIGDWAHGFFSLIAVGATNVGSIRVYNDPELSTNTRKKLNQSSVIEKEFHSPFHLSKGSTFGEFNLGSTIVLVFQAPNTFKLSLKSGQKIKYGESLT